MLSFPKRRAESFSGRKKILEVAEIVDENSTNFSEEII